MARKQIKFEDIGKTVTKYTKTSSTTVSNQRVDFDLTDVPNYTSLAIEDIMVEITSIRVKGSSSAQTMELSYSYTASTGMLRLTDANSCLGGASNVIANIYIIQ